MKKAISISAFLFVVIASLWLVSSCNKDTDTSVTSASPTEETIVNGGGSAEDRQCTGSCGGARSLAGEATNYTIKMYNRLCPGNSWVLVGTWTSAQWPVTPAYQSHPFGFQHAKQYKLEVQNTGGVTILFYNIRFLGTLTNFQTGLIEISSGDTYVKEFASPASCPGCTWQYCFDGGGGNDG